MKKIVKNEKRLWKNKKNYVKQFGKCPFDNWFLGNVCQNLSVSVKSIFGKCPFSDTYLRFWPWTNILYVLCSLTNIYKQIDGLEDKIEFFRRRKWLFRIDNTRNLWKNISPEDKELFCFDIDRVNWERYTHSFLLGARVYMLKDDIHTLPAARKKFKT